MSNISFNDFLDGFDLSAFSNAGGDWELLKSILKNAAVADTSSVSTTSSTNTKTRTNTSTNKSESKPTYASININTGEINKSKPKKKSSTHDLNFNMNTSASTLSYSTDEDKVTTKRPKPLYTVTIPNEYVNADRVLVDKVKISKGREEEEEKKKKKEEKEEKVSTGFSRGTSSIGRCRVMSNSNIPEPDPDPNANPTSFEISSNEGIRAFLYGMRKRLPHTVDFIENAMGDEGNYYDFIYKKLSDEVLDSILEGLDKEMKKYSSFLDCFKDQDN